jgi:hypothetical protein
MLLPRHLTCSSLAIKDASSHLKLVEASVRQIPIEIIARDNKRKERNKSKN